MNITDLHSKLVDNLYALSESLPQQEITAIFNGIEKACTQNNTEVAITELSHLSTFIKSTAERLTIPVLSELLNPMIDEKIKEIRSTILSPPSSADLSAVEVEILVIEDDLKKEKEILAGLRNLGSGPFYDEILVPVQQKINELEQKLTLLNNTKKSLASGGKASSTSESRACAGLRNTSNKCYFHACLKGLWASKYFREIIERKAVALEKQLETTEAKAPSPRRTALLLHNLFLTFDATCSNEVIEPNETAIHELITEMARYHSALSKSNMEDPTEFLNWVFDDIFAENETLFSYEERKKRPPELDFPFTIPNIDEPGCVKGNLFVVQLPAEPGAQVELQTAFEPTLVQENVDPTTVLGADKNKDKDPEQLFDSLSKLPKTISVTNTTVFTGPPPSCLLIHLWRQFEKVPVSLEELKRANQTIIRELSLKDEEILSLFGGSTNTVKIPVQVKIPKIVTLHHDDPQHPSLQYELKGVIVHTGNQTENGHYYTHLPVVGRVDPSPSPSAGASTSTTATTTDCSFPEQFVQHNDDKVSDVANKETLDRDLQEQSYLLIYDKK